MLCIMAVIIKFRIYLQTFTNFRKFPAKKNPQPLDFFTGDLVIDGFFSLRDFPRRLWFHLEYEKKVKLPGGGMVYQKFEPHIRNLVAEVKCI